MMVADMIRPTFAPPRSQPRAAASTSEDAPQTASAAKRTPVAWADDQKPATLVERRPDGSMRVDGVRWGYTEAPDVKDWKPVFTTTTIDPKNVSDVYVLVEPFPPAPLGAHVRLLFEMDPHAPVTGSGGLTDRGLYVSYEARMHEGEKYSPVKGLGKAFRPVYQLGTYSDALQRKTRAKGQPVIRYKLALSADQKQQLLRNCLEDALEDHSKEWYNTASSSCYDVALRQLDKVLGPGQHIPRWRLDGRLNPMMLDPRNAPSVLMNHHLLESPKGVMVEADQTRFPGVSHRPGFIGRAAGAVGRIPGLRPALRIAGAIAGAVVLPGPVGALAGAVVGEWIGRGLANFCILKSQLTFETSESHFPPGYKGPVTAQPPAPSGVKSDASSSQGG